MRFLIVLLAFFMPYAHAEEDLLEPEKAFVYSASLSDPAAAMVQFQIAKGYHLTKNKIKFSADSGVKLGVPEFPVGEMLDDPVVGRSEIYRGPQHIRIPLSYPGGAARTFKLTAEFQGCADVGVCYPPQQGAVELKLAPPMQQQSLLALARMKSLAGNLMGGEPAILSPEQAFELDLKARPDGTLEANYTIAPGNYLYRDKLKFQFNQPVSLAAMELPAAEEKIDPTLGKMYIYHHSFTARLKLAGLAPGVNSLKITASYQGCSEQGICYPPLDKALSLDVTGSARSGAAPGAPVVAAAPAAHPRDRSDSGRITALLQGGNYWLVVVSFFGFGLLLSLTPCVFPMIPILSGIIVGQGAGITKRHGFLLSLAYVLGMACTYALAGVAAGLSGTLISNALQNPWALGTGAAIFVLLALSMFGFYELQLPSVLQSRFTEASNRIKGGRFAGVFLMGVLSSLIIGPCVAAPLAGALLYISQTGDVVLGGVSLFSLALGMGVPLLLVGLSAGALLPRAGAWMEAVKIFFGVALLAVAAWLISPLLSELVQMFLWAAMLMISGVYLKAIEPLAHNANGWIRLWKGAGLISLVTGIALLLGALGGGRDLLQPLSIFKGGVACASEAAQPERFQRVKNVAELDAAVRQAAGRPVMLDFYADWCVSCKEMARNSFADPKVQARLRDMVLLQADVTANTAEDRVMLARFKLFGPPGMIFFDQAGRESAYRVVGYEPPEKFLQSLDQATPR